MLVTWRGISNTPIEVFREYVNACFTYDEVSGELYWREDRPETHFKNTGSMRTWTSRFAGKRAGHKKKGRYTEYFRVKVLNSTIECHIIIWVILYGKYPNGDIDHIDGNGLNNRKENLRDHSNTKNKRISVLNTSGRVGVYYHTGKAVWVATGYRKHIGQHQTFEGACEIRYTWEIENGITPNYKEPVL